VTFEWRGALGPGQAYQVGVRHDGNGAVIRSGLVTQQSWLADLPADKYGGWTWSVSVIQNESVIATSDEWSFWFDPHSGDSGGEEPEPTATR
jgi:hypothetical protein